MMRFQTTGIGGNPLTLKAQTSNKRAICSCVANKGFRAMCKGGPCTHELEEVKQIEAL